MSEKQIMENQVKIAIQEAKDRVAKKYSFDGWITVERLFEKQKLTLTEFNWFVREAMLEYSSSKDREIFQQRERTGEVLLENDELKSQLAQATASSSSGEKGGGEIKWVTSLVYQKIELGKLDSALRVIAVDARSEEEALGIGLKHFEKEMFGYTLLLKVAIQVALSHPSTKQFDIDKLILWIKSDKVKIEVSDILTQIEVIKLQSLTPSEQTEVKEYKGNCPKCIEVTTFIGGTCQKCKPKEGEGREVEFAEASFIAGYKKRAEMDGRVFDFASELHAKSHFIKFKSNYQSPKE